LANQYRAGRIFIAGDAAHSHPPYGGYGVNSGFEDARNLGWKLAAVLQGWGNDELLDSYDAERRPVFASTINDFIAKSIETDSEFLEAYHPERDLAAFEKSWHDRSQGAIGEVHAFEPHYEGSPVVWQSTSKSGPCSAKGSHQFKARPGHHLAPAKLASGNNVYEELGEAYTLLAFGVDESSLQTMTSAAKAAGIPLKVVQQATGIEADRYEASLILVRPDQFVAWVGESPTVDVQLAQALFTHLKG
jgi:hypothetical protein